MKAIRLKMEFPSLAALAAVSMGSPFVMNYFAVNGFVANRFAVNCFTVSCICPAAWRAVRALACILSCLPVRQTRPYPPVFPAAAVKYPLSGYVCRVSQEFPFSSKSASNSKSVFNLKVFSLLAKEHHGKYAREDYH